MAKRLSVAEKYIRDVLAGKIVVSELVRLQIERHQRDLQEAHKRGLIFDREAAQHVIDFFPTFLTHTLGDLDGKPFHLEPFQQAKLWILYGWRWTDTGYRRFKYSYNEIGRGNGKSTEASGLCLYEFLAFGEAGPHVYSAATDKETARIVFNTSEIMLNRSPYLKERVTCYKDNIHIAGTEAKFVPCASEASFLLGLRPSFISMDELHVHADDTVWNVFYSAMGKRNSPLLYVSTNSGYDRNSVCFQKREYSIKVLTGVFEDDTWFAWICGIDDGDDWEDEKNWIKANPGLGVMVQLKELREQARNAKNDPSALNSFLRFRLSRWTESHTAFFPMHKWDECNDPVIPAELRGRDCFGGLDLSTTTDISAFVLLFPPHGADTKWRLLPRFFLPRDGIMDRVRRDRVPYDVWEREGLFILTEGRVIDYKVIRAEINNLARQFNIREIVFDRWNSSDIVTELEGDGFEMVLWGQGLASMNAPTKRLLELVLTGELAHGGHKVLRWMASNTMVYMDPAGNIKPDKAKSTEKIDGIQAAGMALGRGMLAGEPQYTSPFVGAV